MAVITSIVLLVIEHKSPRLKTFRAGLSVLVDPIKYLTDLPSSVLNHTRESMTSNTALKEENKKLREEQLSTSAKLLKFDALEKENIRLRALLEHSYKLGDQVMIAEMLAINMSSAGHFVSVNKGTRFGVHEQQPVFDNNGVVGQIFRAFPFSSEVMLITDINHAIPVQVNRNGLLTIAVGSGQIDRLSLPFLPNNADIKPGDLLITSGLGGVFPQGYPVAVVDNFTPDVTNPYANVTATPKAHLDYNRELLIAWTKSSPIPLDSAIHQNPANQTIPPANAASPAVTPQSNTTQAPHQNHD